MSSSYNLNQPRICAQIILNKHKKVHEEIQNSSQDIKPHLQAAFWKSKLWPTNSAIRIAFMEGSNPSCSLSYSCPSSAEIKQPKDSAAECNKLTTMFPDINKAQDPPDKKLIDPLQDKFDAENPKDIKEMIKTIFNERWLPLINLDVKFTDNIDESNVRIGFDPAGGSWSLVGTDCLHVPKKEKTINFGWFDVGTILHEFGHMLGMIHEHQNPDGKQIDWNVPVVLQWAKDTQGWDSSKTKKNIIGSLQEKSNKW